MITLIIHLSPVINPWNPIREVRRFDETAPRPYEFLSIRVLPGNNTWV